MMIIIVSDCLVLYSVDPVFASTDWNNGYGGCLINSRGSVNGIVIISSQLSISLSL